MHKLRRVHVIADNAKDDWDGWFHGWAGTSERAYALVEGVDGHVHSVQMERVRFIAPPLEPTDAE